MENLLTIWIEDLNQKRIPVDTTTIKQKALRIFNRLTSNQENKNEFSASGGWFSKFIERHNFHNLKTKGEIASADSKAAQDYPPKLLKIIQEGGYTPDQVFNADETGLFWKRLPKRTYVSKTQKSLGGFKAAKDRVTFLLCSNASGDRMIKPLLVNKSLRPRALKGKDLKHLRVHWMANKKAWVTGNIFQEWFAKCFVPEVKSYLEKKKQPFKALLIIDNAPGHPLIEHPNVNIIFLPPNTTSIIQPMDQGIIATFKMYYLKKTFQCIMEKLEENPELDFTDAWKNFSIKDCILYASKAISEIRQHTLNACWKSLWPECVKSGMSVTSNSTNYSDIIDLARSAGGEILADMTREDIDEILLDRELDDDDLIEIATEVIESENGSDTEIDEHPIKAETIKQGLKLAAELENYFVANDTDAERVRIFQKELSLCMLRYKELHRNLLGPKRSIQTKLTEFMVQTQSEMLSQSEHQSIVLTIDSDTNSSDISAGHQNKRLRIISTTDNDSD